MTNVIMVLPRYFPILGGAEVQCSRLIKAFSADPNVNIVEVVTRRLTPLLKKNETIDGVRIRRLPPFGTGVLAEYFFCIILFFYLLYKSRKYDVIHCHATSIFGLVVSIVGLLLKKKVIVKVSTNGEVSAMNSSKIKSLIVSICSKRTIYVALNNEGYQETIKFLPEKNVVLIPNGIEPYRFDNNDCAQHFRKKLEDEYGNDLCVCLFIGRFVIRKGIVDILSVAERLESKSNFVFVFIGDSSLQRDAESFEKFSNLKNVQFLGRKDNVFPYLVAADFFISPSYNEGLPNTVLEALSCGVHCILSDISPHEELSVEHPEYISLFKKGEVSDLENVLVNNYNVLTQKSSFDDKKPGVLNEKYLMNNVAESYSNLYRS
ncbi:glycosyltransferase family 4 protein [Brenneria uluponensis]|uniref:glycosyltransferase family 4 protein n=1 Tax=Brenneria uluponensis TaxID=3057057 RepID=UPI0028E826AE|nr:glycosyltransferase family 4 protein [Brenneria ulupoensis]